MLRAERYLQQAGGGDRSTLVEVEHHEILKALERNDVADARHVLALHISRTRASVVEQLRQSVTRRLNLVVWPIPSSGRRRKTPNSKSRRRLEIVRKPRTGRSRTSHSARDESATALFAPVLALGSQELKDPLVRERRRA